MDTFSKPNFQTTNIYEENELEEIPPSSPEGSVIKIPSSPLSKENLSDQPDIIEIQDDSFHIQTKSPSLIEISQSEIKILAEKNIIPQSKTPMTSPQKSQIITSSFINHRNSSQFVSSSQAQSIHNYNESNEEAQRTFHRMSSPFRIPPPQIQFSPQIILEPTETKMNTDIHVISSSPLKRQTSASSLKRTRNQMSEPKTPSPKRQKQKSPSKFLAKDDDILPIQRLQSFDLLNSSPLRPLATGADGGVESIYLTARENETSPNYRNLAFGLEDEDDLKSISQERVPEFETKVSRFPFKGKVILSSPKFTDTFKATLFSSGNNNKNNEKKKNDVIEHEEIISDSEDENDEDLSIIEIVKSVRKETSAPPPPLNKDSLNMSIGYDLNHEELQELKELDAVDIMKSFSKESEDEEKDTIEFQRYRNTRNFKTGPLILSSSPEVTSNHPTQTKESQDHDEFSHLTMDEVKTTIIQYGLKPQRSKAQMIATIKDIQSQLSQTTLSQIQTSFLRSQSQSQQLSEPSIQPINDKQLSHKEMINLIKKDLNISIRLTLPKSILEEIIIFKPIKISKLMDCSLKEMKDCKLKESLIREWCDSEGICVVDDLDGTVK